MSERFYSLKINQLDYWLVLAGLAVFLIAGYSAAHYMDVNGHWVTGMSNRVVWGLPHVFAIFLILGASGALNIASLASVFGRMQYKPWRRFSSILSICLLIGGLLILVLDLGRPERLIVAMTHYNFKSIFAWNVFLYTGLILLVVAYLYMQFEADKAQYVNKVGVFVFIWRLVLTTGTGSIFGLLVARELYSLSLMAPIFIVLSLMVGTALFVVLHALIQRWSSIDHASEVPANLTRMLGLFIAVELVLVGILHVTNLHAAGYGGVSRFILLEGGIYTALFWLLQIGVGSLIPLFMIYFGKGPKTIAANVRVALLVIAGGFANLYITIICGQTYPQNLFPGKDVSSSAFDGVVAEYSPSAAELLLGLGGLSLSLLGVILLVRILPIYPDTTTSGDVN